jgi:glycosyltransferase involved in cell wall biosynthesis
MSADNPGLLLLEPMRPYRLQNSRRLTRTIFRAVRGADLVHIHGHYLLPQVWAYLAARRYGRPYGVQAHGVFEPYQARRSRARKAVYNALIGRRIIASASYVLFASESEASRARGIADSQKLIIPLAAEVDSGEPDSSWSAGMDHLAGKRVVLFLGRLANKKRLDLLLQAWAGASLPMDARLLVVGPDDDWSADEVRRLAGALGIGDSVEVHGHLEGAEKSWVLRRASCFVLPSDNENFGIAVVEAMAVGTPVIVTDQVAASDHVRAAEAGWVIAANDQAALVAALESALHRDEAALGEMGARGQRYCESHLSWRRVADGIIDRAQRSK